MNDSISEGLAIEIKGLSKAFGRIRALHQLELEVPWGEVLTILGPNGSGKTTLIKVLATLTRPDDGVIRVAGLDLASHGQRVRRVVGVVTHDSLLYDELTGYENLQFLGRMFDLDCLDSRIASVADQLGINSRLHQRVGTLSHGMQRRFSIARALLHDPKILLMDEPESGLDQEALTMLDAIIGDRVRPFRTVLMTTHNLERSLAVAHRIGILMRGGIAYHESLDSDTDVVSMRSTYFRYTGVSL